MLLVNELGAKAMLVTGARARKSVREYCSFIEFSFTETMHEL